MSDGRFVMGLRAKLGDERGLVVDVVDPGGARRLVFGHRMGRQEIVIRLEWLAADLTIRRLAE